MQETGYDKAVDGSFCFDNETPRHKVWLEPFEIATRLVTYGDYLAFMDDGGYQRPELWLSMGWDWVQNTVPTTGVVRSTPLYWQHEVDIDKNPIGTKTHAYSNFTLQGQVAIDPHTPLCHVNYFEADAYARWAVARLPTEHEWEHAARQSSQAAIKGNFVESKSYHPVPQRAANDGLSQLFGDVWEWTSSNYNPYPGYKAWAGAVGEYNGKFMCNQFVLRGGSCITPQSHIRASYRNFFPPDAQWQFSGLRLARDVR